MYACPDKVVIGMVNPAIAGSMFYRSQVIQGLRVCDRRLKQKRIRQIYG